MQPTRRGSRLLVLLRTTDHEVVGQMNLLATSSFYLLAGFSAMLMRGELVRLDTQFLSPERPGSPAAANGFPVARPGRA